MIPSKQQEPTFKYQMQVKQMNDIVVQNMRLYNINYMFKK